MIKIVLNFLLVWIAVTVGITAWRTLSNQERWSTVKVLAYGFTTAAISLLILASIVILF